MPNMTPNRSEIARILAADRIWSGYALADLQPRFVPHCQWSLASAEENGATQDGLVLFFDLLTPTAIVSVGAAAAVEVALQQADLPDAIYLNVRPEHLPAVAEYYQFPHGTVGFYRMFLPEETPLALAGDREALHLSAQDESRLRQLYSHGGPHTPDAFDTYQLEDGVFVGVEAGDGTLLAAGGTHIVDWEQGIAAIGNMYTHPQHRGQGHAGTVLRTIVVGLRSRRVQTIILNVDQRNTSAQRLYQRHGFRIHCPYWEGVGIKK